MDKIKITWLGHSCFKLECGGRSAVIDPYREVPGLPELRVEAGEAYKSHDHDDHGYLQAVTIVEEPGPSPFEVSTIPTFHDPENGTLRGDNNITVFKAGDLKIAHFGDLGHRLEDEKAEMLKGLDAALIPVGGFYTITGAEAYELVERIDPKVVIPMHYRKDGRGFDVITGPEVFLDLLKDRPIIMKDSDSVEISKDSERSAVMLEFKG